MTKLEFFNKLFFQFLFIRICKAYDAKGQSDQSKWEFKGYGILYFVLPFTGWSNDYICIGKKIKCTKSFKL